MGSYLTRLYEQPILDVSDALSACRLVLVEWLSARSVVLPT